jgi:hypothetical protein
VICTLGAHRSGTSLVARILNLLGVHLGPDERILTSGEDNPSGYWEHRPFVDINDEILIRFGGEWDEPPVFPASWARDPRLADLRARARQLVAEDFAPEPLWGWKDPRTCLTLPFWQDLIGPMRYVVCVRNPSAVVASLTRRSIMTSERAERLWLAHMQAILAHTSGHPRMFVFYEDLIEHWPPTLQRMAAFIGDPARGDDPRVHEAVRGFLDKALCHHRRSLDDLAADPRISAATKALYLAMRGHANPDPAMRERRALQSIASLESALQAMTLDRDAQARERETARQTLDEIRTSSAWRLVTFTRGLIDGLLPAGTRRRRLFNALFWRIARRLPWTRAQHAVIDLRPV